MDNRINFCESNHSLIDPFSIFENNKINQVKIVEEIQLITNALIVLKNLQKNEKLFISGTEELSSSPTRSLSGLYRMCSGDGIERTITTFDNLALRCKNVSEKFLKTSFKEFEKDTWEKTASLGLLLKDIDSGIENLKETYRSKEKEARKKLKTSLKNLVFEATALVNTANKLKDKCSKMASSFIIHYKKEETDRNIPLGKKLFEIGEETICEIFVIDLKTLEKKNTGSMKSTQKINSLFAKKAPKYHNLEQEFRIGFTLDHPNLIKYHALFITGEENEEHVIVMNAIDVVPLSVSYIAKEPEKKLNFEVIKSLILQTKECCLYLFDHQVFWMDLHPQNVFIDPKINLLKILEFRYWRKETQSSKCAFRLLVGSVELIGWILECSKLGLEEDKTPLYSCCFPSSIIGTDWKDNLVVSLHVGSLYASRYACDSRFVKIYQFMQEPENEKLLRSTLEQYFDLVLKSLENL